MEINGYSEEGKKKGRDPKLDLEELLKKFLNRNPKSDLAVIVTNEGLPIVTSISQRLDEVKICTMAATLFSLSNMAIDDMSRGEFKELFIKGKEGYLLLFQAGESTIFLVSTAIDIQLRLIMTECIRVCEKIAKLLSS